jgi:hypothetical protein
VLSQQNIIGLFVEAMVKWCTLSYIHLIRLVCFCSAGLLSETNCAWVVWVVAMVAWKTQRIIHTAWIWRVMTLWCAKIRFAGERWIARYVSISGNYQMVNVLYPPRKVLTKNQEYNGICVKVLVLNQVVALTNCVPCRSGCLIFFQLKSILIIQI